MKKNSKELKLSILILLVSLAGLILVALVVLNAPRRPWLLTRNYVLRITPIGTHVDDVRATVSDIENWHGSGVFSDRGFTRTSASGELTVVGDKHMRARVSRNESSGHTIFSAVIYWGFDYNGNLINVYIRRFISS